MNFSTDNINVSMVIPPFSAVGNDEFKFLPLENPISIAMEDDYIYISWNELLCASMFFYDTNTNVLIDIRDLGDPYNTHRLLLCSYVNCSYEVNFMNESTITIKFEPIYHLDDEEIECVDAYISYKHNFGLTYGARNPYFRNPCGCEHPKASVIIPLIHDIYYNDPYTAVRWFDGTVTTVKVSDGEIFDKETGLAMAIAKKYYECLDVPNIRAAFKKAVYKDAHDHSQKTAERLARKLAAKMKEARDGNVSTSEESSEG